MAVTISGTDGISTPPVVVQGSTSGGITLAAPAVAGTNTQTLVAASGTLAPIVSGTAVASTSGTSIDFTGIPSWVKRITVMFNLVSTSGASNILLQIGSGSVTSSGYTSLAQQAAAGASSTAGFIVTQVITAPSQIIGFATIVLVSGTTYTEAGNVASAGGAVFNSSGISPALSGTLDRVRITTVNGTDVFDAGSINILYE